MSSTATDSTQVPQADRGPSTPAPQAQATPAPLDPTTPASQPEGEDFDVGAALVRLLIGVALEGADELTARLREWDASARASAPASPSPAYRPAYRTAPPDARRHTMVGLVFEAQRRISDGIAAVVRRSDEAARTAMTRLAPLLRLTPFDPLMDTLFGMYREWMETLDHLTAQGQIEEQEARRLARVALPGVIDRALDVVTKNPEVRALLQQQGAEVAKSALDEARERVGTADALAERIAHTLLRRPKPGESAAPPGRRSADGNVPSAAGATGARSLDGAS
ncbi:MAG TPA: hypothetical protein VIG30_10505 [Ktedonobacterales bacterium]